jgi:hypothetical protein
MVGAMNRRLGSALLLGYLLLYDRGGRGWQLVETLPTSWACEQLKAARVDQDIQHEIGGALANQAGDNPMRVEAYRGATARVSARWRCQNEP